MRELSPRHWELAERKWHNRARPSVARTKPRRLNSIATAIKRQHDRERVVGDLLTSESAEKQARSIKYQMTIAKQPLAKDIEDFDLAGTQINETLVKDLAGGNFLAHERNVVLIGGTGTGRPTWLSPSPVPPPNAAHGRRMLIRMLIWRGICHGAILFRAAQSNMLRGKESLATPQRQAPQQ